MIVQAEGHANPSMILSLLNEEEEKKRKETVISGVGAAAYTGRSFSLFRAPVGVIDTLRLFPRWFRYGLSD